MTDTQSNIDHLTAQINKAAIAVVTSDVVSAGLFIQLEANGIVPDDIKGGGKMYPEFKAAFAYAWFGKGDGRKFLDKNVPGTTMLHRLANARELFGKTAEKRVYTQQLPGKIRTLRDGYQQFLDTGKTGDARPTGSTRTGNASAVNQLCTQRDLYKKLATSQIDQLSEKQAQRLADVGGGTKARELVAAYNIILSLFPAKIRRSEGVVIPTRPKAKTAKK